MLMLPSENDYRVPLALALTAAMKRTRQERLGKMMP